MTFSAVFGLHKVLSKATHRGFTIFMDVFIVSFLLGIIVPGLVFVRTTRAWYFDPTEMAMVGTYGSCPLLLNL
jgi:hypothetical protein